MTTNHDFARLQCESYSRNEKLGAYNSANLSLVPIGGGKDSCVTLHLLGEMGRSLLGFSVNDQPARNETFAAAGFADNLMLRTRRMIDPALLARNAEGFWNGHTPFSAIVAFLGLFCAYLVGADELVLSNEASANEASVPGTEINHHTRNPTLSSVGWMRTFSSDSACRSAISACCGRFMSCKSQSSLPLYRNTMLRSRVAM